MATMSDNNEARRVGVRYFGHSAFLWTTPAGSRILIDPFGNPYETSRLFPSFGTPAANRWFLEPFPRTECDVLLVTHPHFDHDAIERVEGSPTILRDPLELRTGELTIRGFEGRHAGPFGKEFGQRNIIFTVEVAGITFCHLGDNQEELPDAFLDSAGGIDVLMVTVDDNNHLLSHEAVDRVIHRLRPSVAMPTHYLIPGLTDPASTLGGIASWLARHSNIRRLDASRTELAASDLPEQTEVWVFDSAS